MNTAHASTAAPVGDFSAWAFAAIHCTEPWMPLCSLHARARRGGSSLILLTCCAAVHRLQARRPPRPAKSQSSTPPTPQTAAATPSQDRVSAQNCTPCVCCSRGTARVHHTDRCRAEGAAADRLPSITLFPLPSSPSSPMHSQTCPPPHLRTHRAIAGGPLGPCYPCIYASYFTKLTGSLSIAISGSATLSQENFTEAVRGRTMSRPFQHKSRAAYPSAMCRRDVANDAFCLSSS